MNKNGSSELERGSSKQKNSKKEDVFHIYQIIYNTLDIYINKTSSDSNREKRSKDWHK